MNDNQRLWARSQDRLVEAVTSLGYHKELAELLAGQLGSPKAIDRMTGYVLQARPNSEEMLVDEALAICDEINAWRERKTSMEAQARYSAMLFHGILGQGGNEDDE